LIQIKQESTGNVQHAHSGPGFDLRIVDGSAAGEGYRMHDIAQWLAEARCENQAQ
jgi:hypothetical protein